MNEIPQDVVRFLCNQNFVVVSTVGRNGIPHASCKGILKIDSGAGVYLMDVYKGQTYSNLLHAKGISVTAVDEHHFKGYCLKGKAEILRGDTLDAELLKVWDDKIAGRIAQRVLHNIKETKGHPHHPEAQLPRPEYVIQVHVEEVVDLTPPHLKQKGES